MTRWLVILILFSGCSTTLKKEYLQDISQYRQTRLDELTKPKGWLSVSGLFWLDEGTNTFGAAEDNSFRFPHTDTPTIGAYQKADQDIIFGKIEGVDVTHNGKPFEGGFVDPQAPPVVLNHGPLYWYLIQRGEKVGIRLLDTLADNRMQFSGITTYDPDMAYKVKATVREATESDSVSITNVLGQEMAYPVAAYLQFTLKGEQQELIALDEGGEYYFVIFSDETTGVDTYGGGRFIYPAKPCEDCQGITILDFNKSQNPPCAFSDFATCPLPPTENHIPYAITVGEKYNLSH